MLVSWLVVVLPAWTCRNRLEYGMTDKQCAARPALRCRCKVLCCWYVGPWQKHIACLSISWEIWWITSGLPSKTKHVAEPCLFVLHVSRCFWVIGCVYWPTGLCMGRSDCFSGPVNKHRHIWLQLVRENTDFAHNLELDQVIIISLCTRDPEALIKAVPGMVSLPFANIFNVMYDGQSTS